MVRMPTGVGAVSGALGADAGGFEFAGADGGQDFGQLLDAAVRGVDSKQLDADSMLRGITTGENVDMHGTMIALEEANIALRTMGSVRDKMVEGWQAVWNMPV